MIHGPGDVPQLRRFIDDSEAPEAQKRIEHGRLDALLGFTEAPGCRRQVLLRHFGEPLAQPCGNCDLCLEPDRRVDLTEPARKALSAVYRTGQRFGAAHVIDVLLGGDTARIRELGHDGLSVHGIGRDLDRGQWRSLFRQLIALGYLVSDSEARGGLRFGEAALVKPLLRGEASLALRLAAPSKERRAAGSRSPRPAAEDLPPEAAGLMDALRAWRLEQARSQAVPPYVVFHDRTLLEIAERRPLDLEALAAVGGVGAAKLERYGEAVLAVVRGLMLSLGLLLVVAGWQAPALALQAEALASPAAIHYRCEGELLLATTLRGPVDDPSLPDPTTGPVPMGGFVLLDWGQQHLQLPRSNNAGAASFTDGRWWWSLEDPDHPSFRRRGPGGAIESFACERVP
jgi:hypothetical protein